MARTDTLLASGGNSSTIFHTLATITVASFPDSGELRLIQHRGPKLALQIMLAVMLICGIVILSLGTFRHIVPWNPCTIASTMILFAGSKMCESSSDEQTQVTDVNSHSETRPIRFASLRGYRNNYVPLEDSYNMDHHNSSGMEIDTINPV
jgi:hypothetical protein